MSGRPTVTQVAQRAGVSIASVSRVLNGLSTRPATVERVKVAASELGYYPDSAGKALKLGRSLQMAFAVDDVANPVYTQMMRGIEHGLGGSGARLLVSSTGHRTDDVLALVESLSRGFADGLVISPLHSSPKLLERLACAPVPVVVVGDVGANEKLDAVRTDSHRGVSMAFDHLVERGRSRIAFVNGPADTTPGRARLAGFLEASKRHGMEGPVMEALGFTVAAGEAIWPQMSSRTSARRVDAVIAANDLIALGIARAAMDSGRSIPSSLAVVGVDDIEMASIFRPSLTTVSLGAERRGQLAAAMLLGRLTQPGAPARRGFVAPRLIVRASTGRSVKDRP
jgi:LacI family transcriptional regulator